jgi:hypothetical protein
LGASEAGITQHSQVSGTVRGARVGRAEESERRFGHKSAAAALRLAQGFNKRAGPMATDYDQPRTTDDDTTEDSIEELKARRDAQAGAVDVDEAELAESLELPGADLSGEELTVRVVPRQADEFTCNRCFLVRHRSQLADVKKGVCRECAA